MNPSSPAPMEDNILGTLSRELNHEYVRVRRSAIDRARGMLVSAEFPDQVMALLKTVSVSDSNLSIRDQALQVLETFKDVYPEKQVTVQSLAVLDVHCSLGHANHFDKAEICNNLGEYWRRSVIRENLLFQEVNLPCQSCGEGMVVEINCDGFY